MSELDQLLKQDPDFLPLNDWKKDNDTGDEIKNRKNYADYVRGEYVSAGAYSDRIANEIAQSTLNSAVADGVIKADDQAAKEMLFTPDEPDLDTKLQTIQTNLDTTDPAWDAATKYLTFKKLNPDDAALPEDIRAKGEQYLVDAQSIADTGYRKAVKSAVRSGELPLAKVKNDKGEFEILVSPTAGAMNMAEAIRASKKGGVTFADASAVQSKLSTPIGFNEPSYKVDRYLQAASLITEFAKKDSYTSKIIQNYSDELASADKDGRPAKSFDDYVSSIRFELNKSGLIPEDDALSNEEVSKALTQIAYNNANENGGFKLYDDPKEAYKNVRSVGFQTPFVHPSAMVNDEMFTQSVTNNPNLSADQKKIIEARREPYLQASFDQYNKVLSQSSLSDDWLNALQSGRVSGKKDSQILKEFTANPDNFSEVKDRLAGVGQSIVDGLGEMVAAVPMMMGADWARDYMVGNIKERSNRREVARLFGAEYGVGQDIAESLAPMLADMAATGVLATLTMPAAGVGGAAFLTAKQGARLTAKGLLKGITSNALRQLPTETAEAAAERLVAQGLIKASTAEAGRSGAMAAIKAHNSLLAKGAGVFAAQAVPSYNRSAGATYASVYATLENNKDLTPEERHDRALGAGLAAGATTAIITGAFGAFGRGGLEDALLSGASRKQIKNVVARLSNVDDIPDDVFNKVISKQVSETLKKYGTYKGLDAAKETGKQIFKNSVDEGAEEGLDEFINGFISDAATDEDTPFLEKLEQAGRAALIGGIIGGGVPAVKAIKGAVMERPDIGVQIGVETEFARGVSDKLTASGSPLTAQTVYSILTAPRRTRAPIAQTILDASREPVATAEVETEVEDIQTPTAEQITEALNNSTSPDTVAKTIVDERGQSQFAFVEDIPTTEVAKRGRTVRKPAGPTSPVAQQLEFDYTSKQDKKPQDQLDLGLDTSSPENPKVKKTRTASSTKSIKKAKLAEQLGLDFDSASVDEQNNHINANYSDEDLTDQDKADLNAELAAEQLPTEERNRMLIELFGAIESQQTKAPTTKGKKATKNIPAQATAQPPILGAAIGAKEPMFSPDEFIDDEMIGQEVASLTRIATLGYPVRLERKALHGMPQRGTYPKGYLVGKSDMVARKISELYPVRVDKNAVEAETIVSKEKVSFYDPKVKSVVRRTPKASIDKSGVGIFNNDPVSMKLLLDRRIPVVIPDSFVSVLNPSFRTYTSGGVRFLNDIVMTNPETGTGFVSVLTKEDQVISSEPNYKYYANLSSFTALFNPEITSRSVPNPRGVSGEVTLDEIIQDADQLAAAASSGRPNSAYGDPEKARATLRVIVKPRKGTLETEFFEAAVPAFNMSVRKEAIIHELRLGMDKFSERKSGEATPTLKTDKIAAAIDDLVSRTKVDKDIAARNIAGIFGLDIDPETEPDLVLQKFIENEVLVRPPFMPTLREIGAKVGNAFAEQQRSRDIFSRKALFETTDPTDLAQIQDDTELFDPEAEAADNTFIAPTTPFEAPDSSLIGKALKEATFDAADALDSDPEMRSQIDRLLRRTVFKGNSAIDITKLSSTDAFGMLASWMSSGNYNTNPDAIKFQRDLRDGVYVSGDRMRRVMKMMYLSSKTIEGDPTKDVAYVESIRENLESSFGRPVSRQEASDYLKSIGNAIQPLWSRSYVRGEQIAYARQQNDAEVARLGLKTNDPESVIKALKTIASSEPDANKRLLAKLLLENQGYIRQVEFTLDESPLQYAGAYMKASNGSPMISVNLDGHNGRGLVDVLLHEYTHAFVSISVASPNENLNAAQRGSLQRINGILELARRSAADNGITDPTLTDGLENVNEFVTHFFTSTDFQGFLKALLPPAKQRGFFARMVDAVLDMFGLGRSKQSDYQKAFTDIVDLTKEAVLRAPMTPAGLINRIAGPASRTLNQVSEAAKAINDTIRPTQVAAEVETTAVEADIVAEQETEAIIQEVTEQDIASSVNSTTAETLAKVKDMIRMVRRMVPAEFVLQIRTDIPYAAAFQGGKILLNPNAMSGVVAGLDDVSARGIVEGIMTEEAAHAASYNALTQQELDNYVATLKESDFDDVIDRYYQTDELRVAAKARIRSEAEGMFLFPDDSIGRRFSDEALREREGMAEELLRMHSQKVTRGFTTEEDYMFWRSKPSLLKIIGRYMKGFINRYMAGKSVATMNGTQRATLQRMITEVRAINAGYRLTPNTLEFDAQNPHATMAQIAKQIANAPTELTEEQIIATQFGSGTMAGIDADAVKADTVAGIEVGTRSPTTKGSKNTGFDPSMQVDLKTMRTNPEVYRKNAVLLVSYPIVARELRDGGNGSIVDRIRSLDKKAIKIDAKIETQKELLVNKDKEVKVAVAGILNKSKSKLRAFDIRSTIENQMAEFQKELEAKPEAKAKGLAKIILEKTAIENKIAELRKDRKTAAENAKKALNDIALDDKQFSIEDADAVYNSMITATESNLSSLIELFPKDIRHLAKLWYDGANRIAQRLSRASKSSLEQAAGVLAVFSPQKDWYMNVSLAERMMKFWTQNQNAVFDQRMVDRYMMRSGEPQITGEDENGYPIYQGKAVPEFDSNGQPVIDPVTGRQKFINWDAKSMEENLRQASLFIEQVRGKKFSELTSIDVGKKKPLSKEAVQARFIRMFSEVNDGAYFPVVVPDGRTLGPSLSENGKPISIAWGGYNTIEKAIRIMRAEGSPQQISKLVSNELGEKHKVRSFFNNIAAPQSELGHVTMDTHAIAALLWRALSGASLEVTQNFGGAGTSSDGALGLSGLYAAFAEAYRRAASNFNLLPREAQSITWEAVRMLFPAKWKGDKKNVAAINKIWTDYENGQINIEEARDLIFQLSPVSKGRTLAQAIADRRGVGRPDWSRIQRGDYDSGTVQGADDEGTIPVRGGLRDVPLIDRGFTGDIGGIAGMVSGTAGQRAGVLASQIGSQLTPTGYERLTPSIYERSLSTDPDAGRRFVEGISRTASEHPMGAAVEVKPAEYYNDPNNRLFLTEDGLSGVSVTSYGDLVSVFKHPTSKARIKDILAEAAPYAVTLDAFDINGFLPDLYANYGFRPAARVSFSRDYAPDGWPYELAGEPDVVLMVKDLDGDSGLPEIDAEGYAAIRDSIPLTDDYDAAMAMQTAAKEKVAKARAAKANTSFPLATQFGAGGGAASQLDADYMKAVESGDIETAQRMVDEAAKKAGFGQFGVHRSTKSGITEFKKEEVGQAPSFSGNAGFYFAFSGDDTSTRVFGNRTYRAYLKTNNPAPVNVLFGDRARVVVPEKATEAVQEFFKELQFQRGAGIGLAQAAKKAFEVAKNKRIDPERMFKADAERLINLGYDSIIWEGDPNVVSPPQIVVLSPDQIKSADPVTYDNAGNVIPLSKRFDVGSKDIRYTQFGAASQLPVGFDADTIDYSNFLESLEMPMMEIGTYQSPKGMLDKLLKGELDPRILRLKNQRDFFNKATFDLAERYKTKLDAIIKRDFGGIENAPVDLIQDATGSTKGLALPEDVLTQIEDDFNYDLDVIDTDDTLTAEDKRIARGIAMMNRDKTILDAEKILADSIRTRRDDALGQLATQSPDLVKHIVQLRTLTDEMSKKVASLYGFPPELKAKFDNQLGIYLTRTYKMFDEIGFGEKVLNDPDYETVRDAAINFFEKQFIDSEVRRRISGANGVPRAQAEAEAKRELGLKTMGGRTYGQLMMEEFINSYDKTGKAISATNMSRQLKPLLDNVQLKRDLPKEIRDLLGEKGAETGVDNLIRSLITTGSMAANQSFLNNVRDIGRAGGWLITATELADGKKKDYDTFGKYKSIRESTTSSYDPLGELYGPPEMVDAFRKVFSPDGIRFNQTAAQEVVGKTIGVAARLSGAAMAAKTLGSIGFYVRNVVSNALFFAPAQGFVNFKSMAKKAYDEVWSNAIVDPTKIDSYRTKLISLGIIGDDINTSIMTAMLRGGNSVDDIETKLGELIDTAKKGAKPLQWLSQRAQVLSGSVDAFYKIAYYENELRVLKEARAVDTGTLASASDSQLERMAADKVLATAQSSSQAPPLVQEVTKSGIGLLFAPFLRFKVEVPRIVLNTYKTAMAEMKSSNPVLKQRGITRFAGMTAMLSGVSAIVPAIASAVAGIGEDEDEALRSSVPEYLRNHTFFYRRKADGQLQSWDFTFLNPFSILADPTMRSMEQLFRGNPAKAAAKFVETAIFDQYLDDQILSSAVQSLRDNENPSTKKPIYEEKLDNAGIVLLKSLGFLFKEAYQPSVMKRAIESYQAVGADYTEFDDSPAGILMREFYPVKRHDIELDKQLRNYLADTRDVFNRVSERKNALFSKKAMETDSVKEIIQSEIEDKAKINEDVYKKLRGFEGLGLSPQQLYQITTGMGYGKDRTRLLFNKIMDRPVINPEFIKRLSDPENEQGAERLKAALEVLQGTPRYIMLEP
jgi:hypothetical protein